MVLAFLPSVRSSSEALYLAQRTCLDSYYYTAWVSFLLDGRAGLPGCNKARGLDVLVCRGVINRQLHEVVGSLDVSLVNVEVTSVLSFRVCVLVSCFAYIRAPPLASFLLGP